MPISIERFTLGHSLVSNKFPKGVKLQEKVKVTEDPKIDLQQFGLFEYSTPNFNTYFPEVTAADLAPKDEEFVYPIFRALSKGRVDKWGPINFSKDGVLEKSVKKLIGQTIYTNHDQMVGNEVGVIIEATMQESSKQQNVTVPGGINVKLKIDGKANPKLARSVMMDPPAVHSVSVTVEFVWEQSHPGMSREEFYNKQGTFDAEGKLIERVVTDIINYHELSLVSHGADPFAQKVDEEGEINNPKYAARKNKFKMTAEDALKIGHFMDWRSHETDTISFSTIPSNVKETPNPEDNPNKNTMKPELLAFCIAFLGLSKESTEDQVTAKLQEILPGLKLKADSVDALKAKYPDGVEILSAEQKTQLATLPALKKFQDDAIAEVKAQALKMYHVSIGGVDKAEASITKMIAEATHETATALLKQYSTTVEEKFPATCQECSSTNVKRASSEIKNEDPNPKEKTDKTTKSNFDAATSLMRKIQGKASAGIHGLELTEKK